MRISGNNTIAVGTVPIPTAGRETGEPRYLHGPVTDFLCLGGISFLLLPILFVLPEKELNLTVAAVMMGIAHFINHPHFAFSYQIFYENFRHKAFGPDNDAMLRARYVFAGIVVPAALVVFFAYNIIFGNARLLGYGGNLMGFLVGWHYVKQGYGMLMVDAALKRQYFDGTEKKILLINAYAMWVLTWMMANTAVNESQVWGVQYYTFHFSPLIFAAGCTIAIATGVTTTSMLIKKWHANGGGLPISGVTAYVASLYPWLLFVHWNALWLLVVPALHSLQYLVVVTRYRVNRFRDQADAREPAGPQPLRHIFRRYQLRFAGFVTIGVVLGFVGFWLAPGILQVALPYDRAVFGPAAMYFVFWIFINVHHYFLDNVMWRSNNPDVRKYLFS